MKAITTVNVVTEIEGTTSFFETRSRSGVNHDNLIRKVAKNLLELNLEAMKDARARIACSPITVTMTFSNLKLSKNPSGAINGVKKENIKR